MFVHHRRRSSAGPSVVVKCGSAKKGPVDEAVGVDEDKVATIRHYTGSGFERTDKVHKLTYSL